MPMSAIEFVAPDKVLPVRHLAEAIDELTTEPVSETVPEMAADEMLEEEAFIQIDRGASDRPQNGVPSGFTCPECGGGLWEVDEAGLPRYRCRTGHGYSIETLLAQQSGNVEAGMWAAVRALEERAALSRRMAARFRTRGRRSTAERFERQANAAVEQGVVIRRALEDIGPELAHEGAAQAE
jgi:two-component system chemotaxis response regulator CheB